jgi:hypothetical protein
VLTRASRPAVSCPPVIAATAARSIEIMAVV